MRSLISPSHTPIFSQNDLKTPKSKSKDSLESLLKRAEKVIFSMAQAGFEPATLGL